MATCDTYNCDRSSIRNGKCVLHCSKNGWYEERETLENQKKIYEELVKEVVKICTNRSTYKERNITEDHLYGYFNLDDYEYLNSSISQNTSNDTKQFLNETTIQLRYIHFPKRDKKHILDYLYILEKIGNIDFRKCTIYSNRWELKNPNVFFDECTFLNRWTIYDYNILANERSVLYQICDFKRRVTLSFSDDQEKKYTVHQSLFSDCNFQEKLVLDDGLFKSPIFNNRAPFEGQKRFIRELSISNSIIQDKFTLNNYSLIEFSMQNTEFKGKVEVKENLILNFNIEDSNFEGLADFFETNFGNFKIYKSIFYDFAGFEHCSFGEKKLLDNVIAQKAQDVKFSDNHNSQISSIQNPAIFQYVTFLDFINFRNTNFSSGLDLSESNFSGNPNFLNATVDPDNTPRETYRILKHSFDKIGNNIEGNRFYKYEILKLKEEYQSKKNRSGSLLLWFYEILSDYGNSYWRPFVAILITALIYYFIDWGYQTNFFYENCSVLCSEFAAISRFLNDVAASIIPISRFLKEGIEFLSLFLYVLFVAEIWLIILAIKRHTKR